MEGLGTNKTFFIKSANFFLVLFYNVYKEKMFTIEIEDGGEGLVLI